MTKMPMSRLGKKFALFVTNAYSISSKKKRIYPLVTYFLTKHTTKLALFFVFLGCPIIVSSLTFFRPFKNCGYYSKTSDSIFIINHF